jgi:hypothetical protein
MDDARQFFYVSTNDPNPPPDTAAATAFSEGQKLAGCYALLQRLPVSDSPEVWLAHDEVLGKDVTLHFLPPAVIKDNRALQELRQDIKRNRQLIHPQILRVYDLIEEPGWAAISMNAFAGESVAARLSQQPEKRFGASEIEPWVSQFIQTVEDAHKIHFLHRDLAPENLFLTPAGQVLVANFGISRTLQEALARAGLADTSRAAYMSPQTLEGSAPARTDDVYSLGSILYTLLVGTPAFTGPDLPAQIQAGITAPALSALEKSELQIPPAWQKAIGASLQKSPEGRPQTASEFLKILKGEAAAPALVSAPTPAAPAPAAPTPEPVSTPAPAPVVPAPVPEKLPAVVAPVVEAPPVAPAPVAKAEIPAVVTVPFDLGEPVAKTEKPAKKEEKIEPPVPSAPVPPVQPVPVEPTPLEKFSAALAPEPEVEIVESKALEALAKTKKKIEPAPVPPPARPEPKKPVDRPPLSDFKPRLYPEESRFPIMWIGVAAVLLLAVIIYKLSTKKEEPPVVTQSTPAAETPAPTPEKVGIRPLSTTPTPPTVVTHAPTPTPPPTPSLEMEKAIADKQAALDKATQSAAAVEKAHADTLKQQQLTAAALADSQKAVDEKTKANNALKAAVDNVTAQRKKLEDSQKAAEAAADEAQKMAVEKARLAEEGKKSLADLIQQNEEKAAALQKAAADLESGQKELAEKQHVAADAAKAAAAADAARQQQLMAVTKGQQELESAQAARDLQRSVNSKIEALQNPGKTGANIPLPPVPVTPVKTATPTPAPMVRLTNTPVPSTPIPSTPVPSTPAPRTPLPSTPVPSTPVPSTPVPSTPIPSTPAPATPVPSTPSPELTTPSVATGAANSLGLKFAPVGDVEFCIWLTRVKDFEVFAKAVSLRSTSWQSPGFRQASDHPVVNVTWLEAIEFCTWLSDKEHKEGTLPANQHYRLPTDMEWSKAVGLPEESGKTAEARDMDVPEVYPWGTGWPPPPGAGNYTGEETGSDVAIKGYDDGFAWTSPVGSFKANKYGLYDMGGNVWQWCMDNWNTESKAKVLRGASWYNGALKLSLLSSCRVHAAPDSSTDNYGFRLVRVTEGPASVKSKFR